MSTCAQHGSRSRDLRAGILVVSAQVEQLISQIMAGDVGEDAAVKQLGALQCSLCLLYSPIAAPPPAPAAEAPPAEASSTSQQRQQQQQEQQQQQQQQQQLQQQAAYASSEAGNSMPLAEDGSKLPGGSFFSQVGPG